MTSLLESTLSREQHALIKAVLVAQTGSFGRLEAPIVEDQLRKEKCRKVLDVGCGEGSFLLELGRRLRGTRFLGIDHNELAIADALRRGRRTPAGNVSFRTAFFDAAFEPGAYDAILTRYTLQHASDPLAFVGAVRDRLRRKGRLIAVESLDTHSGCREPDEVWDRFRASVAAIHRRAGSNDALGQSLGWLLRTGRLSEVTVSVVLCAPSTVGFPRFRDLVRATAETASGLCPDLFDHQLLADVRAWLAGRADVERKDPYLCSAIAMGVKP